MRKLLLPLCIALGVAALALPLSAYYQDMGGKKDEAKKGDDKKGGDDKAQDDMAKAMEPWMKYAAPGPNHDHLKPMAGKWEVAGKFRMSPDAPWTESKSTATIDWVLGGRFLNQKVDGEAMPGMPGKFEGFGLTGYDNMKKKYVSVWADNMGTMLMTSEGTCDNSGKTITMMSHFTDAATMKETYQKWVYKISGNDKFVMEGHGPDQNGKEFLTMELNYSRKK